MTEALELVRRAVAARGLAGDPAEAVVAAALGVLERAHHERPAAWLEDGVFVEHALGAVEWTLAEAVVRDLAQLHAGDLFVACACGNGVGAALQAVEQDHLSRVREFAASVDGAPAVVAELTQQLRERLFVGDAARPPRILQYSGRGSLGAWIRVSTVRLALDEVRARGGEERAAGAALEPEALDPELGYLKDAYGGIVSTALAEALGGLDAEARGLLKMHYVDGVSIEHVGTAFGVSRATAARRLASAREQLLDGVRERLASACGARVDEADSLLALVRSRLDLSLARALRG